jgi:hypothetical protein
MFLGSFAGGNSFIYNSYRKLCVFTLHRGHKSVYSSITFIMSVSTCLTSKRGQKEARVGLGVHGLPLRAIHSCAGTIKKGDVIQTIFLFCCRRKWTNTFSYKILENTQRILTLIILISVTLINNYPGGTKNELVYSSKLG